MKKQILSYIPFFTIAMFLFTNCQKKDDTPPPASKTNTQRICENTWKFSSATVGGANVSGSLQTCQKDNILTFVISGTGNMDEGPTKCNAGDPQNNPFIWNFASSETKLHISAILFSGGNSDFTIVSLTDTQLKLSQIINGQTVVVTFIH